MQEDPDFQPIPPEFHKLMNELARELDERFNPPLPGMGGARGPRKVGFFLTCFEFNKMGRFNYISNADKLDV